MVDPASPARSAPTRPRGRGYLLLFVVLAALIGVVAFGGDRTRSLFGLAAAPSEPGMEPGAPQTVETGNAPGTGHHADMLPGAVATTPRAPAGSVIPTPPAAPRTPAMADQTQAVQLLAQAEAAYRRFDWSTALRTSDRIVQLTATPETIARTREIASGASEFEQLFKRLDDRDEWMRNHDTDPLLVVVHDARGKPMLAVPLTDDDASAAAAAADPVAWLDAHRQGGAAARVLLQAGKSFIEGTITGANGAIVKADLATIAAQKRSEIDQQVRALTNSERATDALAWYEVAKFAYRNRLDAQVTDSLDRARDLEPDLVTCVREDKAAGLYAGMIFHLKQGNRSAAASFMTTISKSYADTDQGQMARLYYDQKWEALLTFAREAALRRTGASDRTLAERVAAAKHDGDEARASELESRKQVAPADDTAAVPGSADETSADDQFARALAIFAPAIEMPPTEERNRQCLASRELFKQSAQMYRMLSGKAPGNTKLSMKVVEANQMVYMTGKYITVSFR
ncbi:MAG: hypothetical protein H0W83_05160 [Planctomycetes bacterium]|nr:hypothetical protein [Planctomycetota bacterium]